MGAVGAAGLATAFAVSKSEANAQQSPTATTNSNRFIDKVVLITGATSGIGEVTAKAFANEGASVHFCGRREELGAKVAKEISDRGGRASYQKADIRNEREIQSFVDTCVQKYGRVDIAFNNAGIDIPPQPLADIPAGSWDDVMNTNARGVFLSMKYEIPQMIKQGGGYIVNTASIGGHHYFGTLSPYLSSKHVIIALTKIAAQENTDKNIRINSISPGWVKTPMMARALKNANLTEEQAVSLYPAKRAASVQEIAEAVMWLCSPEASYVAGADLEIAGGGLA
jgi:NAD(P)-dependent dehydrogenase (short-subunit alcohol dehydrogenase family)